MCGIVGFFAFRESHNVSYDDLLRMRDTMISRGPDDGGIRVFQGNGCTAGLAHRRLSIIDLSSRGHQPMGTVDERYWIVYNGEIFNFKELRELLRRTGRYVFKSDCDTEVLLYAHREWGVDGCLKRLRGMYAFGLFDCVRNCLILVRDPLGVKPLYYVKMSWGIAFASEIKALLAMPGLAKEVDYESLSYYLTFANVPAPKTLFCGIRKLEAGCYLRIDGTGNFYQKKYWEPASLSPFSVMAEHECVAEIRRLLRQAVERRMVSDVPFGVFLSGGVDSSLNVALMSEMMDKPVQTFSIGIKGDSSNEFLYARKVAKYFGTDHHEIIIGADDFESFLPQMVYYQDEPLADPVCVPLYYVSKLARESGTIVIQVGEGSDEIFAGYQMYHSFIKWEQKYFKRYKQLPRIIRRYIMDCLIPFVSVHLKDALRRAYHEESLFMGNAIAFWDTEKEKLLRNPIKQTASSFINNLIYHQNIRDPLLKIINIELTNRLPELLLMRVDKMSMANSIETRVPFLDEDLVEFALTIPSALKYKNGETKYILKKAAEGIIPDDIIYRKKWGFCGSATNMLTGKLLSFAHGKIINSSMTKTFFNQEYIEYLFRQHQKQPRFNSFKIWNLLNLVLWYEYWFI